MEEAIKINVENRSYRWCGSTYTIYHYHIWIIQSCLVIHAADNKNLSVNSVYTSYDASFMIWCPTSVNF